MVMIIIRQSQNLQRLSTVRVCPIQGSVVSKLNPSTIQSGK